MKEAMMAQERDELRILDQVMAAWQVAESEPDLSPPATESELDEAERRLGRPLPEAFRKLYLTFNGGAPVGGNIMFHSIGDPDEMGPEQLSETMRHEGSPVPDELILFGSDGGDSTYGLWLPRTSERQVTAPVIEVGEAIFDSPAIAGTSLARFLRARTAYYVLLYLDEQDEPGEAPSAEALGILGVPADWWTDEPDDHLFEKLYRWSDPAIPDPLPDPYQRGLTLQELRAKLKGV